MSLSPKSTTSLHHATSRPSRLRPRIARSPSSRKTPSSLKPPSSSIKPPSSSSARRSPPVANRKLKGKKKAQKKEEKMWWNSRDFNERPSMMARLVTIPATVQGIRSVPGPGLTKKQTEYTIRITDADKLVGKTYQQFVVFDQELRKEFPWCRSLIAPLRAPKLILNSSSQARKGQLQEYMHSLFTACDLDQLDEMKETESRRLSNFIASWLGVDSDDLL